MDFDYSSDEDSAPVDDGAGGVSEGGKTGSRGVSEGSPEGPKGPSDAGGKEDREVTPKDDAEVTAQVAQRFALKHMQTRNSVFVCGLCGIASPQFKTRGEAEQHLVSGRAHVADRQAFANEAALKKKKNAGTSVLFAMFGKKGVGAGGSSGTYGEEEKAERNLPARTEAEEAERKKAFALDAVLGTGTSVGKRRAPDIWMDDEQREKKLKLAEESSRLAMLASIESKFL